MTNLDSKAMTNLDSILKHRDITLPTKVHLSKLWFFQQSFKDVRVGSIKKAERLRIMLLNYSAGEDS